MAQKQSQKPRICSKWSPWSAGCGSWSCGLSGRINEESEWCFVRWLQFCQNLEELAHGVRPGHADILVLEHEEVAIPRPGLFLPCSAQVQLGQCLLIGQMVALGLDDDNLSGASSLDMQSMTYKLSKKNLVLIEKKCYYYSTTK